MKTAKDFGPWTMSAHDCRMSSFWQRRMVALESAKTRWNRTSPRHGGALLLAITVMILMPSWQVGEQAATAQEQHVASKAEPGTALRARNSPRFTAPATPMDAKYLPPMPHDASNVVPAVSRALPATNKLILIEGSHRYLDMPKGGELSTSAETGVFEAKLVETSGDILVRGLKSGIGTLKFSKGEKKKVEFQVVVVSDPAPLKTKLGEMGLGHIMITPGVHSVLLSGHVSTPTELKRCVTLANDLYPHVVNNIRISNPKQVQLNCRIFEFTIGKNELKAALNKLFEGGELNSESGNIYSSLLDAKAFSTRFEELSKIVKTKMVADPVLTTVSGRPAAFNAGGEFPILIPQSRETVAVEYKQFGTRIDFTPHVLRDNRIRLEMRPQLTEIMHDENHGVKVDGRTIPALKSRWVNVATEMTQEQTLVSLLVHENEAGEKVGFVTMVRPSLVTSGWNEVPVSANVEPANARSVSSSLESSLR